MTSCKKKALDVGEHATGVLRETLLPVEGEEIEKEGIVTEII